MKPASLVLATALAALVTACGPGGPGGANKGAGGRHAARPPTLAEQQAQARTVTVVTVEARGLEGGVEASGSLVPREETSVYPEVNGFRVLRLLADQGQYVQAGQTLAVLDDTLLRSQIDQQAALLAQQQVQAARARSEATRVNGLDDQGVLAQEAVEARRFAARAAQAQAAAQAASLRDLRTRQGRMSVRAPYAGVVLERSVRVGDISAAGATPWFRIARGGVVELAADVPESALSSVQVGTPATVTLADGTQVIGAVRLVSPQVTTATRLGQVRITLPPNASVRPGGFARATFTGATVANLAVPETAVRYDAAGAAVMIVGQNNRVTRQSVTTGRRAGGYVELLTGPPAGTRIVSRFAAMLVSGDTVRPVADRQAAARPPQPIQPATPSRAGASTTAPATGGPPPPATGLAEPVRPVEPVRPAQPVGTPGAPRAAGSGGQGSGGGAQGQ